jgi:hypothetical protein
MDQEHATDHRWPGDEPMDEERREPPRNWRERIVRALGDAFLTAGMGRGVAGGRTSEDVRATTNVILFGEGDAQGRDATRGSGSGRR